ncbi:MAG: 3,4-dihydroxy-2-butanone-4-phosphate synthase [Candidatus Magasanikbacteria bacterium]|nr:3,4-dihydroxy-2-butanone-4-phosphate synthase [Candidatus Magasanikbacteria bacterium]
MNENKFDNIEDIVEEIKNGRMVVVLDDEDRENEGDLIVAAEKVNPAHINFMATHGRGIICVAIKGETLDKLGLPLMIGNSTDLLATAWTVTVDAKEGVTTGASAFDRAKTVQALINSNTTSQDLDCPGHMFPLRANVGGLMARRGHTEAAVELANLSGLFPAGVICEILNEDGSMARAPQLFDFAKKHKLRICTIEDLIQFLKK